jgi:hypothetical protein
MMCVPFEFGFSSAGKAGTYSPPRANFLAVVCHVLGEYFEAENVFDLQQPPVVGVKEFDNGEIAAVMKTVPHCHALPG